MIDPTAMEQRSLLVRALAILAAEGGFIFVMDGARATAFIRQPGKFRAFEPALRSDVLVFFAAPVAALVALAWLFAKHSEIGRFGRYTLALVLSAVTWFVAMSVSLGTWGS
jgi:hypothetical protein